MNLELILRTSVRVKVSRPFGASAQKRGPIDPKILRAKSDKRSKNIPF
jgi:hypothetical protein